MRLRPIGVLAAVALVGGCGGGEEDDPAPEGPRFTAQQVAQRFEEVFGERLQRGPGSWDGEVPLRLRPDRSALDQDRRFGSFELHVLDAGTGPGRLLSETEPGSTDRRPLPPGPRGTVVREQGADPEYLKVVRNVVLEWSDPRDGRGPDARFDRLVRLLESLGRPASSVEVAASERPCPAVRISFERGDVGACRVDGRLVTVVAPPDPVRVEGLRVDRVRWATSRIVVDRRFSTPLRSRARGRFVVVGVRLANVADGPVTSAPIAGLQVGRRTFSPSFSPASGLQPPGAFPLQPGTSTSYAFAFDVSPADAMRVAASGRLAFGIGADGEARVDPQSAPEVRAVRLVTGRRDAGVLRAPPS